jgi:hypothetical protein
MIHTQHYLNKVNNRIVPGTRTCSHCNATKPLGEFPIDTRHADGHYPVCRECMAKKTRAWYARNSDTVKEKNSSREKENPEKRNAWMVLNTAIARGDIRKPNRCESCNKSGRLIEAHHWKGYDDAHQLDVQWLCRSCHKYAHTNIKNSV